MTARTLLLSGLLCTVPACDMQPVSAVQPARHARSVRGARSGRRRQRGLTAQQPDETPEPRPPVRLRAGLCVTASGALGYSFTASTDSITCTRI